MNRTATAKRTAPPRRVLILEGRRRHGALMHLGLHSMGHDVRRTPHPVIALRAAREAPPDVFVVDFDARGGAVAFLRALRAQGIVEPVLVVGRNNEVREEVAALDGGADDYVPASHDLLALDARIRTLPRRARARVEGAVGRVEIDEESGTVRIDGDLIPLSETLFAILAILVAARGSVVTREEVLSRIGHHRQSIKMHVCRLRAALGPAADHIETVHGKGYRFIDRGAGRAPSSRRRSG